MCCTYRVVLLTKSRSVVNMIASASCTLTHFDRQFLFISGSLKNDVHTPVLHTKLQTSITQRRPTILLIDMAEFAVKCPVIVCTQTARDQVTW